MLRALKPTDTVSIYEINKEALGDVYKRQL